MTHYYSGRSGDKFTENTLHASDDCHHLQNSDGFVRPVTGSTVDDLEDADYCGTCCDLSDDEDDELDTDTNDEEADETETEDHFSKPIR